MLSFQRLDVYQRAIEFVALAIEVVEVLPRGHAERGDQLIRAAESVVRNIAEGAGRWSDGDASKHYRIARGEAMESASSLDVLKLSKARLARPLRPRSRAARGRSRHADQDALTVKGGDQVHVQVHVKAAVNDAVHAHVNENVNELPDAL
jgi:four helix bundle protein